MKKVISLNGEWEYSGRGKGKIFVPQVVDQIEEERAFYGQLKMKKVFFLEKKEKNKRYVLRFEGVSYYCRVFCNHIYAGEHEGIWDSFQIDITDTVQEGENTVETEIIKPNFDKKSAWYFRSVLFGFIPDVMLPFGGIWKEVTLEIKGDAYFERMSPLFDAAEKTICIDTTVQDYGNDSEELRLAVKITAPDGTEMEFDGSYLERYICRMNEIFAWDPDHPHVYRGKVILYRGSKRLDEAEFSGGFRDVAIRDGEILLNGKPFYMRGILHWGCYPEKMAPIPSYEEVKRELSKIRKMGFNAVKHCLYFPPAYYYELCDEMGIVTWQEFPLWLPYKNNCLIDRVFAQYPVMTDIFRRYPTVILASLGCELDTTVDSTVLNRLYHKVKSEMPGVILCGNSGSAECFDGGRDSETDIYDYHFYAELYNLNELLHEFTAGYRKQKPWVFGEFNDSDTFRLIADGDKAWWNDPDENKNPLRKVHKGFGSDQPVYYQGEILERYGVQNEAGSLKYLSIEQMKDIRKFILETARSFPEIKGYNITTLCDVPITTAGILNDKMEYKVSPDWLRQVNSEVTVSFQKDLARIWKAGADRFLNKDRYNYFAGEDLRGRFVLSNRKGEDLCGKCLLFLEDEEYIYESYESKFRVAANSTAELMKGPLLMPETEKAKMLTLRIHLEWESESYENTWNIWVYPGEITHREICVFRNTDCLEGIEENFRIRQIRDYADLSKLEPGDILVTDVWGSELEKAVEKGVRMICFVRNNTVLPVMDVPFYREGVVRMMEHPAMDGIAHRGYAGIQFFGVASSCAFDKLSMERKYPEYKSMIRRYDARKFFVSEYAVEIAAGYGKAILSTLNPAGGKGEQPVGMRENKLGTWLLNEWIKYLDVE